MSKERNPYIQNSAVVLHSAMAQQSESLKEIILNYYVKNIIETSQKLSSFFSSTLKKNKQKKQEFTSETQIFYLSKQIRRSVRNYEESLKQKNITLNLDLEELIVNYDENMLEIVWDNLILNAIKFTEPGGRILIKLKSNDYKDVDKLVKWSYPKSMYAKIEINHSGSGTNEGRNFKEDSFHFQKENNLAFTLAEQALELVGGTVFTKNESGNGSTFTVYLRI